jgi:hypothetical protein
MSAPVVQTLYAIVAAVALATSATIEDPPAVETAGTVRPDLAAKSLPASISPGHNAQGSQVARSRNPRVLFIITNDCLRCEQELSRLRRPGGDFEKMRSRGWEIGEGADKHLQIVDRDAVAELVRQLGVREYPTVACIDKGEVVRSFQSGCTTPLDVWTFGWLAKGIDERPQAVVLEAARVESTGSYRLRGNHWSVDGDWSPAREKILDHLRSPAHAGQLLVSWQVESWSYEELRSLHDDLHERELGNGNYASRRSTAQHGSDQFGASRKILGKYGY